MSPEVNPGVCVCVCSLTSSGPPVVLVLSWFCTDSFVGDCLAFLWCLSPCVSMWCWHESSRTGAGVYGVENAPLPSSLSHSTITRGPSGIMCAQSFKATGEHGPSALSLDIPSPPLLKPVPCCGQGNRYYTSLSNFTFSILKGLYATTALLSLYSAFFFQKLKAHMHVI